MWGREVGEGEGCFELKRAGVNRPSRGLGVGGLVWSKRGVFGVREG